MRYAVRVNGIEGLAITKLDVLDQFNELKVCTAYRCGNEVLTSPPADVARLAACIPMYETFPGWVGMGTTAGVRLEDGLPHAAREYLARLEELCGVPISIISTGSDRKDTIVRNGSFVSRWLS